MAEAKDYIIGIDTGGTFTDVVVMSPERGSLDRQGVDDAG